MALAFRAGARYVSSTRPTGNGAAPYVRHRHFTPWVETHGPDWRLLEVTRGSNSGPDRADFFTYERVLHAG
jgi:hypothetical protein